ncbi:MAG: FtsQ-type POTRA domain-containing protein [Desulfovibrio sp.]|nr:FtsQ-type POTRA domain-containing protein [Desulfovibrio sp.]
MNFGFKKGGHKSRNTLVKAREPRKPLAKKAPVRLSRPGRRIHFKSILVIVLALAGFCAVVALVGAISLWLYGKAITSDFFTTRHIDVAGNTRLTREMVLQYGGLSEGDNSLGISIADVERNLRDTPWVEEVSVKRLLPDRFVIKLKERMPSFWVHKDGALYYANEAGEIIAPVESRNFLSLPTLRILPGGNEAVPYLAHLLRDLQNGVLPMESGAIAQVTASPSNGVEIYLEDREMRLSIATDDWDGNMARLGTALGDLARRHELSSVREARAVDGNVWIIRNQSAQQ